MAGHHLVKLLLLLYCTKAVYTLDEFGDRENINTEYEYEDTDCIDEHRLFSNINSTRDSITTDVHKRLTEVKEELLSELKLQLVTKDDLPEVKGELLSELKLQLVTKDDLPAAKDELLSELKSLLVTKYDLHDIKQNLTQVKDELLSKLKLQLVTKDDLPAAKDELLSELKSQLVTTYDLHDIKQNLTQVKDELLSKLKLQLDTKDDPPEFKNKLVSELKLQLVSKDDLQDIKQNLAEMKDELLTDLNLQLVTKYDIQGVNQKLTDVTTNLLSELKLTKEDLKTQNSKLDNHNSKLDNQNIKLTKEMSELKEFLKGHLCLESEGFFRSPGSHQCLKSFRSGGLTWDAADARCRSLGLQLVKPFDAIGLMNYMSQKYGVGSGCIWIGGRSDGSVYRWSRDEVALPTNDPLWLAGYPKSVASTSCLYLDIHPDSVAAGTPYSDYPCSTTCGYICERIMG